MAKQIEDDKLGFHAGRIIQKEMRKAGIKDATLADGMGISVNSVRTVLRGDGIGAAWIVRASMASGINLFQVLASSYREWIGEDASKVDEARIAVEMAKVNLDRVTELLQGTGG